MDSSFIHADIFFVITSIAIVLFTILFTICGIYIIKILHSIAKIADILKENTNDVSIELREMAEHIKESPLFAFIFGQRKQTKTKIKRATKK